MHLRDSLIPRFSELIYYGFWYSPEMEAMRAFIDETQKNITGTVRIKLYKGECHHGRVQEPTFTLSQRIGPLRPTPFITKKTPKDLSNSRDYASKCRP